MENTVIKIESEADVERQVIEVIGACPKICKTEADYTLVQDWRAQLKTKKTAIENFFLALRRPFKAALDTNRETELKMLKPLEDELSRLRAIGDAWFMEARRKAQQKQADENAKHQQRVEAAVAKGKDPESVKPPKQAEAPPTKIMTSSGGSISKRMLKYFRLKNHHEVTEITLREIPLYRNDVRAAGIPDTCWMLDRARAAALCDAGALPDVLEHFELPSDTVRK